MEPKVSLILEPERLIESEATLSLLTLSLSEPPPPDGIVVRLNAPNLSEFDLSKAQIEGGIITLEDELQQQLQTALDGTRTPEVPGAVVAIVAPFGSWYGTSGVADLENNIPLQPSDRFQIGSITKTFVATTVLQLVEEGSLSLEDTLTTWLPESLTADIPNAQEITIRQILQHTSGIADYLDILFTQAATNPTVFLRPWEPEQLMDLIDGAEPVFEPGESWQYSNTNYILAGLIVEAATGNNIAQEIRNRILTPLNLENTFFAQEEAVPGGFVNGYWDFDSNGTLDNITPAGLSWAWTAGAMISNAQDLDTFARSLFKEDRLLEPETLEQMLAVIPTIDNNNYDSYGLGVGTLESAIRFWYAHRGQTLGYRSNMWYSPQDDLTYIELINGFSRDNLVRDILPPYRQGIADDTFEVTLTEQTAQITLPVADDGEIEGEETATFSLEAGEGYEVDPEAQTGTLTIVDTIKNQTITQVSLSTSTNFDGDLNALVEDLGNALTVRFDLDGPAPEGGLKVFVDSNVEQIVNRLDLPGFAFNPITENIKPALFGTSFDNSGFYLTIDEGATFGTFTIDVFDNPEPDTFLPETFDGLVEAVFELKTEVAPEDLADVGTLGDYTIDPNAAASTVLFVDDESQLSEISEPPPPEPPELDVLQVSLFTGPSYLIEDEVTVSAHAFNVTNGTIPEGGLVVSVDAPNLSEFDLAGISVDGGTIEAVRDGGFDLRMTQYTTLVNLPIADDGETETGETASFSLAPGDGYEIVEDYSGGSFNLVDTRSDIPRGVVTEPNDIVSLATDTQITPENPSFFAVDSIYFDIGNRYLNEDGTYTYVDYNEDVDLYKLELTAGDTIAVETFEVEGNRDVNNRFGNLSGVAIFDAEGNRLISSGLYTPAAPDKLFGVGEGAFRDDGTVVESETDTYLEFTASEDGIYYVGVSSYLSATPVSYGREDLAYDIEIPASGDDNRVAFGLYELEINLLTEDNPRKTGTPTPPVSNPNVINPPTLSLGANPTTVDSEGNFTSAVVEFVELGGISGVNFTIQAEGEIPEEGIEFVLNSDVNLFDYVSYLGQDELPTTVGGQSLGAYYNEEGIPTGIRLRIDEPTMTVNLERANRNPVIAFQHDTTGFYDLFEGLETDGPEDVTFFLQPGEGYEVAPEIGTTEVTYYDSLADVPPPSGGDVVPEVGLTVSETFLIESEETETTFSFTLSEAPPEGGITVFVDSEDEPFLGSILGQFSVLEAEIEGGNFPVPNSDESGFFFTITDQTATITVSVFDELTVIDNPVTVQEGLFDITFALQPQEGYTIDSDASEITLTIADNPDSKIQVGLTGSPASLIESEETVSVHTFTLSSPPPEEGLTVSVSADALDEFNLDAIDTAGGTIAEVRDDGFDFNITEREATINLPVLDDGVEEGSETALFSLDPSENYLINQAIPQASFAIADTPDQASVSEEIEGNSTIAEANALGLSSQTPTVSINGTLAATGPSNQTPERWLGFAEDVDMYAITLEAGQTVSLDIDTGEPTPANNGFTVYPALVEMPQKTDTELRLFDAQGNELAANSDGAAPGEEFSRDPYLEFTAETAGTYYVGVSLLGNRNYDPNVVRSGSGWTFPEIGVFYGDYELTATLEESSPESMLPVFGSLDGETFDAGVTPGFDGTDDILFGGSGDDFIDTVAGNGGNRLYGQSGDDTFILGHNDRAFAGAGDDSFFLLGGNNVVTGGAGSDSFWLAVAEIPEAANTITDFDLEADVLGIAGLGIGFDGLTISEENGDTLIATGDDELAKLLGVSAGSLSADHFVFG
ncbi:hypothetical protein cce_3030 [Crocosphaera subtropica ATCC 51142]|uniref:Serine-type D-Ala-D-Ala carboxypeptidase n=1 Tax=Crocosphaera subtropica (strain ATCC 51142 / BH68) TaxID=43989 RepID=B1WW45_CROS5|nr:serine hydrolase [Crocosphaera subtropica]ACB52378.1 hypothetical protein cce_3030 [Crocosphaera subtropica ATCC 51142]